MQPGGRQSEFAPSKHAAAIELSSLAITAATPPNPPTSTICSSLNSLADIVGGRPCELVLNEGLALTCPQGSFVPKGEHGIHAHRAARGNVARRGRDQCKQECDARKCQWIVSANAKYKTLQEARQEKPAGNANQYPDERES